MQKIQEIFWMHFWYEKDTNTSLNEQFVQNLQNNDSLANLKFWHLASLI